MSKKLPAIQFYPTFPIILSLTFKDKSERVMSMFAKIFAQIFDSSISADYVVRHIFMDLLVLADRDGVVDMTLDAISRRTNVPVAIVAHAISELMKEDRASRSHDEAGCRLIPLDSHRDWGWQIVNYEHYRNLKDEEARRAYFRDKKREQRQKSSSQTLSNGVKDSPTLSKNVTQAEAEAKTKSPKSGGSGGEFMAANHLFEELCLACGPSDIRLVSQVIANEARIAQTTIEGATDFLISAGKDGIKRGEVVNAFWYRDRKFAQNGNGGGKRVEKIRLHRPGESL